LPQNSLKCLNDFEAMKENAQRDFLDGAGAQNQKTMELIRVLFSIVSNVKGDKEMSLYALALINGILEDKRTRIRLLVSIQSSANRDR